MTRPPYFLIAVSDRDYLNLCIRYGLAGFTSSIRGAWTFSDIPKGSRISFLYGAKAYNLYVAIEKFCIENSDTAPPWKPLTFRSSGKTYTFPFRLRLEPIRKFEYPLTSKEFSYVAENLLLRGGYRKTHFQADATNLSYASELGERFDGHLETLTDSSPRFDLLFTKIRDRAHPPEIFLIDETILQAAIRHYLADEQRLSEFLKLIGIGQIEASHIEALGEKALPQGYVDILLKEANPTGISRKILIEVKRGTATSKDFAQLQFYMKETGAECLGGILVASKFPTQSKEDTKCVKYALKNLGDTFSFEQMVSSLDFQVT